RGERLVHRGVVLHPRVALRHGAREGREAVGEVRAREARATRAAAVVQEADDGPDAEGAEPFEPRVGPGEGRGADVAAGTRALPEDGVAERRDPQPREQIDVGRPAGVAAPLHLVEVPVPHAVDGALHTSPELEWGARPFGIHAAITFAGLWRGNPES